ncbi:MAG: OadG family protein [Ruminococcus sp.]|jgi:sodium pump decarboxylase gamma subunit|nr:OadG family protein [Ruminococcus sp.]
MKKKVSILLSMIAVLVFLTGCGATKESSYSYDDELLKQTSELIITQLLPNVTEESLTQVQKMDEFAFQSQLYNSGIPMTPQVYLESANGWIQAQEECGAYLDHGDYSIEVEKDIVKLTTAAQFKDRSANITFTYDDKSYLQSVTVSADYSMGEILKKAILNTLLGMGTVFLVLIFISIIISLLKYVPDLLAGKRKTREQKVEEIEQRAASVPENSEPAAVIAEKSEDMADTVLVAVIAAAIASAEEISPQSFVVRSIKRRPENKW